MFVFFSSSFLFSQCIKMCRQDRDQTEQRTTTEKNSHLSAHQNGNILCMKKEK